MTDQSSLDPLPGLEDRFAAIQDTLASLGRAVEGQASWLTDLQRWVSSCVNAMVLFGGEAPRGEKPELATGPDVIGRLLTWTEIQTVMSWVRDAADVPDGPLVSVTLATRDRPEALQRAIASVLDQSYSRLELIVVDDSDGDETERVLEQIGDPRLLRVRTPARRGPSAAYNAGLDAARGEMVAFLDDDNVMHHHWIRSVVWAFGQRPAAEALYGARIVEDVWTGGTERYEAFPAFQFARYDRRRHERGNSIDRNVLAIRAARRDVRYDEALGYAPDWDYTLRLFAQVPPLALPVVACYYGTTGPGRISEQPNIEVLRLIRSRAHTGRPLCVHVHCTGSGATLLADDVDALRRAGAKVSLSATTQLPSVDGLGPWRLDLEQTLQDSQPDLVLMDSPGSGTSALELVVAYDLPFALRTSSPALPESARPHWLGSIEATGPLEPALRDALTRWLYQRTADWTHA